jgi:hypothetical protein
VLLHDRLPAYISWERRTARTGRASHGGWAYPAGDRTPPEPTVEAGRGRRPVGKSHPSLLLNDELARAVRTEAAAAVMHWVA